LSFFKRKTDNDLNIRQKTELEAMKEKVKEEKAKPEAKQPKKTKTNGKARLSAFQVVMLVGACGFFLLLGLLLGLMIMGGVGGSLGAIEVNPLVILILLLVWGFVVAGITAAIVIIAWRWKSPESWFFLTKIRLPRKILVWIHDYSGNERPYAGSVSKDGLTIEVNGEPVGFSPKEFGEGRSSYWQGIDIIRYFSNSWRPIGTVETVAAISAEHYYNDPANGFKILPRLDPQLVMRLYQLDDRKLAEECSLAVSVDKSSLTIADLPFQPPEAEPLEPRREGETDDEFNLRSIEHAEAYKKRYFEEWNKLYGKKDNEDDETYKARLQDELNKVYYRIVTAETDALKAEVMRLKDETKDRLITSQFFVFKEAMKLIDPRVDNAQAQKLKQIKESQKPKQEAPQWFKWVVYSVMIMVGGGVLLLLVAYALHMVGLG
jgi:hypothetical protein